MRRAIRLSTANRSRLLLVGGLLLGFGVRLYRLGSESLWYDETVSVHLARLPLAEMLARTAGDIHPPGYYALLHLWQVVTQPSLLHGLEFLFGWPSLVMGLLALPLLYALGRRLLGESVGLTALWLAAVNPFAVWYSQEVRMYTLGAALGLLCLWAVLKFAQPAGGSNPRLAHAKPVETGWESAHESAHESRMSIAEGNRQPASSPIYGWLVVYVLAAAAGLYTLYYFLFLLLALNLAALLLLWLDDKDRARRWRRTAWWLGAQVAVIVLWLPWLPVFWRQATDPPVPPWRSGWDGPAAFLYSLSETLAALLVGQTPPGEQTWPWALVTVLLLGGVVALVFMRRREAGSAQRGASALRPGLGAGVIVLVVFTPIAVLYAATLLGAPIYHVRYLSLYAPLFLLVPGAVVAAVWRRAAWLGAALAAGLVIVSAFSLHAFWTSPLYRADDHRGAVAELAGAWRPGDVILANAGWIYPVLTTYWPAELPSPAGSLPPPLQPPVRLVDYAQNADKLASDTPLVVRSGSVDGPASLGWGDPAADFFAISRQETTRGLEALAQQARRIWHYRLYDTVSDPDGTIRAWLADHAQLLLEKPIPGRDFGMVQLFDTQGTAPSPLLSPPQSPLASAAPVATFGGAVALMEVSAPPTVTAGSYLYADLLWEALPPLAALPADLSTSLRLYDSGGQQVAQADGPPAFTPTRAWEGGRTYRQAAALPVPADLPPGSYSLQVIVYRQDDAQALPVDATGEQVWRIGEVDINRP